MSNLCVRNKHWIGSHNTGTHSLKYNKTFSKISFTKQSYKSLNLPKLKIIDKIMYNFGKNQSNTLVAQLNGGVRVLDYRVFYNSKLDDLYVKHNKLQWNYKFHNECEELRNWIHENQNETIILRIKKVDTDHDDKTIAHSKSIKFIETYFLNKLVNKHEYPDILNIKLHDIKGKIIFIYGNGYKSFESNISEKHIFTYSAKAVLDDVYDKNIDTKLKLSEHISKQYNKPSTRLKYIQCHIQTQNIFKFNKNIKHNLAKLRILLNYKKTTISFANDVNKHVVIPFLKFLPEESYNQDGLIISVDNWNDFFT